MDINLNTKLPPKFVRVNSQNQVATHNVKNELTITNYNYKLLYMKRNYARKDKHMPIKIMKFNTYKHKPLYLKHAGASKIYQIS